MNKEISSEQLAAMINNVFLLRNSDIDVESLNLRFCPTLESCDGPSHTICLRYHTYPWMANPKGVTHGGIIAAIMDNSMGTLCSSHYECGFTPTITMTVNYALPVPLNEDVLVRVRATFTGRASAQLSAEMFLPDRPNTPLATASGVYHTAQAAKQKMIDLL